MSNETCIKVWRFRDAPKLLQGMSDHGGDEDWLVLIPANLKDEHLVYLLSQAGGPIGVCDVSRHELPDGRVVLIGAHA